MLRKAYSPILLVLLPLSFLTSCFTFAQNIPSEPSAATRLSTPGGPYAPMASRLFGPGRSLFMSQLAAPLPRAAAPLPRSAAPPPRGAIPPPASAAIPLPRAAAPQAGVTAQERWIPGHYEVRDGRSVWVPGQYESTSQDTISITPASPQMVPSQRGPAGPVSLQEELEPPVNQNQAKNTAQWIPGQTKTINGVESWVRGQYSDQVDISPGDALGMPVTNGGTFGLPVANGDVLGTPVASSDIFDMPVTKQVAEEQIGKVKPRGWAVVIGISEYKYAEGKFPELRYAVRDARGAEGKFPELRYAVRDARGFFNLLHSPKSNVFSSERTLFLEDEKATLESIKYAFFDFLKKASEEDYVVIYFSGHGTPDKDNSKNLYLMAYDSQPDRLASTAFPMWDIDTAFKRHIKSKKIVMFADACHSAGINGDIKIRDINRKNMINHYLLEVAKARNGRMILTASEAGELSQESKKWGGGHGVFTYFLLNGLKGEADVNENNIVTLGELTDFVSESVRRATGNTQHPNAAGIMNREFPLSFLNPKI
jgi:uncharacterized caspase-like protein